MNMGCLILEVGDNLGDEPSTAGIGEARAEISKTPPGLMFGPAWRAGPSCVVSEAPEKGPEAPPWSDSAGMGAHKPKAPRVWQLGPMQAVPLQEGSENEHL